MGKRNLNPQITIGGRSMILNVVFVVANLAGLTLVTIGSHKNFENNSSFLLFLGYGLIVFTTVALLIFKGRLMMSAVARLLVGGLFIVSGLVKANDPIGFSYKLEEYFQDGALAYRIKELFVTPGFSLEFLVDSALTISVIICIAEIVFGVLLIIGGKIKLVSYLALLMMLFFTFLTWHTANCDKTKKFKDRDTYVMSDAIQAATAARKIEESKTNKTIKVVSSNKNEVVVDEMKSPQCVSDCGCFGDAMKGSVGRSLSPHESFWKDIVVLYLCIWIFLSQWIISPNTRKQNFTMGIASLVVVAFFAWVFSWYFTILFAFVAIVSALWIKRSGGKLFGTYVGSALIVSILSGLFVTFVLLFEPMKDYRPYALGSNLIAKMNDGQEGKYQSLLRYKNVNTQQEKLFDASSSEYSNSKIWEKKEWKYLDMKQVAIEETRISSISDQFNPFVKMDEITDAELSLPGIDKIINKKQVQSVRIKNLASSNISKVPLAEFSIEDYDVKYYTIIDTIFEADPNFTELNIRDYIVKSKKIVVVTAKNLSSANWLSISEYKEIYSGCKKAKIPCVILCSATRQQINAFRKKYKFDVPIFVNDETELKAIARSNPSMMVLKNGKVVGKFAHRSTPDFNWLKTNILK